MKEHHRELGIRANDPDLMSRWDIAALLMVLAPMILFTAATISIPLRAIGFDWPSWIQATSAVVSALVACALFLVTRGQSKIYRLMRADALLTNRAFVFVNRIDVDLINDAHANLRSIDVSPAWINSGNTQTKALTLNHFGAVLKNDETQCLSIKQTEASVERYLLGPNGTCIGPMINFDIVDLAKAYGSARNRPSGRRIFVFGYATYFDLYSELQRRTEYCIELVPTSDPSKGNARVKISFHAHGRHNCSDEECIQEDNWFMAEPSQSVQNGWEKQDG